MPLPIEETSNKEMQVPLPVDDMSSKEDFSDDDTVALIAALKAGKTTPPTLEEELHIQKMGHGPPFYLTQSEINGGGIESPLSIDDDDDDDDDADAEDGSAVGNQSFRSDHKWRTKPADLALFREIEKAGAHAPPPKTLQATWEKVKEGMQRLGYHFASRTYQLRYKELLSDQSPRATDADLEKMDSISRDFEEIYWNIKVDIKKVVKKREADAKAKAEKEAKLNAAGKDVRDKGAITIREGCYQLAAGGEISFDSTTGEMMARRSPSEEPIPLKQFKSPDKQDSASKKAASTKKKSGEDLVRDLLSAGSPNSDRKQALDEQKHRDQISLSREELRDKREEQAHQRLIQLSEMKLRGEEIRLRSEESQRAQEKHNADMKAHNADMKALLEKSLRKKHRPSKKSKDSSSDSDDE
jgi:hypothetical protein